MHVNHERNYQKNNSMINSNYTILVIGRIFENKVKLQQIMNISVFTSYFFYDIITITKCCDKSGKFSEIKESIM